MIWWQYLILVNVYLVLFYGFYVLLLRRETFFQLNRIYLVSAALLSFFIPLIQSDWVQALFITQKVKYSLYSSPVMLYKFKPIQDTHITIGQIFAVVYVTGMVVLMAKFAWQLMLLNREIKKPDPRAAYSFFKKIKLGEAVENAGVISAHEHVHASQWHSADVLLIEAVMIINWFNPVVYFYRFAIKHIHEFIADQQAIEAGTTKADYALLLLSQTFNTPAHQLANPFFNHSLLKERIVMLQKNKSHRIALVKYGLSAPLFILMLVLSSATINNSKTIRIINNKAHFLFLRAAITNFKDNGNHPGRAFTQVVVETGSGKTVGAPDTIKAVKFLAGKDLDTSNQPVFSVVEHEPSFPGGMEAFFNYLGKNIQYPADSREKGIQGKVIISFTVEKDGTLSDYKTVRGIASDIDEEALRVLKLSPKWEPGVQNGRPVRVQFTVPIAFSLQDGKPAVEPGNRKGAIIQEKNQTNLFYFVKGEQSPKTDTGKKIIRIKINQIPGNPLCVVDGVETKDLSQISPANIESINVLKGDSPYNIYGTKGVNGVLIVTTKKKGQ